MRLILLSLPIERINRLLALRRCLAQCDFLDIITDIGVEALNAEERRFQCVKLVDQRAERGACVGGFPEGIDYGADEAECCEKVADGEAKTYRHRVLWSLPDSVSIEFSEV
jgi:hypothetical protein